MSITSMGSDEAAMCADVEAAMCAEDEGFAATFQSTLKKSNNPPAVGELPLPLSPPLLAQWLAVAADAAPLRGWPEALHALVEKCAPGTGRVAINTQLWGHGGGPWAGAYTRQLFSST